MKKIDDKKIDTEKDVAEGVLEKPVDESLVWKDKYLRAMADYQNLEKRSREAIETTRLFAAEIVIQRLLPVVDTLTKVKDHLKDSGFDLAYKQLQAVLEELGVEKMIVINKKFNPHEMECVEVVDLPAMLAHAGQAGGENDIVIEEALAGYMFRGKVLRVAQVKVGKKMEEVVNV